MMNNNTASEMDNPVYPKTSFYWQSYGLKRDPFLGVREDDVLYIPSAWENQLDILQHSLHRDNVILGIIGEEGVGKTTFSKSFINYVGESLQVHAIVADTNLTPIRLADIIEKGFRLPQRENDILEERLDTLIADIQYSLLPCVLLIDDAHLLPKESLQALLYLIRSQSTNQMRLHVILFGNHNLQSHLANLAKQELSGELIQSMELSPFTLNGMKEYLKYRLEVAGHVGPSPFSEQSLEHLYQLSDGVPEKINHAAQQYLLDNLNIQPSTTSKNFMQKYKSKIIGASVIMVVFLAFILIFNHPNKEAANQVASKNQPVLSFSSDVDNHNQQLNNSPPIQHSKNENIIASANPEPIQAAQLAEPVASPDNAKPQSNFRNAESEQEENLANKSNNNSLAALNAQNFQPDAASESATMQPVQGEPIRLGNQEDLNEEALDNNGIKASPNKNISKKDLSAKEKNHSVKNSHARLTTSKTEKVLLKTADNLYTLQLLGVAHEENLKRFLAQHKLQSNTYTYRTILRGKPWYVLIYGKYKSKTDADKAKHQLPLAVQHMIPWSRSFASIKEDIRKLNG